MSNLNNNKGATIKDYCEVTSSKRIFASQYVLSGVPFYRGKEISEKQKASTNISNPLFISREVYKEIKEKHGVPQSGEILLTSVGTLGNLYLVGEDEEFYFKDGNITWFRNLHDIDSKWLFYWLKSPVGREQLSKSTIGASQKAYTINLLQEMEIDPPQLEEQIRISSILGCYDDLIENNEKRIKVLETMVQSLHEEWFVKFKFPGYEKIKMVDSGTEHGLIPEFWTIKRLCDVTSYIGRGISPQYDNNGDTNVINQKCIRNNRLDLNESRRQIKPFSPDKRLVFGDIVINSTGVGTLGRIAQIYENLHNYTADSHVTIVRPNTINIIDYLGLLLISNQNQFEVLGVGATGQTELSRDSISNFKLVVPPLKLLNHYSVIVRANRMLTISLLRKNKILNNIKNMLIQKLIK